LKTFDNVAITEDNIDDINVRKELTENNEVGLKSYRNYLSLGKLYNLFFLGFVLVINMSVSGYSYYFYNSAAKNQDDKSFDSHKFLKYFIIINIVLGLTEFFRILFCYVFGINISIKLHGLMLIRIMYSSINNFFNKNTIGKVLNRLSGDL